MMTPDQVTHLAGATALLASGVAHVIQAIRLRRAQCRNDMPSAPGGTPGQAPKPAPQPTGVTPTDQRIVSDGVAVLSEHARRAIWEVAVRAQGLDPNDRAAIRAWIAAKQRQP